MENTRIKWTVVALATAQICVLILTIMNHDFVADDDSTVLPRALMAASCN